MLAVGPLSRLLQRRSGGRLRKDGARKSRGSVKESGASQTEDAQNSGAVVVRESSRKWLGFGPTLHRSGSVFGVGLESGGRKRIWLSAARSARARGSCRVPQANQAEFGQIRSARNRAQCSPPRQSSEVSSDSEP